MRQKFFMVTETEAEEETGKNSLITKEIQDQTVTKDRVQDRITKDLIHILVYGDQNRELITEDFNLGHQQDKIAEDHREMDLEIEVMVKSL